MLKSKELDLELIKEGFEMFDVENKGIINPSELKEALEDMNLKEKNLFMFELFSSLCSNQEIKSKGGITLDEFINFFIEKVSDTESRKGIKDIFNTFSDVDDKIPMPTFYQTAKELGDEDNYVEIKRLVEMSKTGGKELNNQEIRNCLANAKTRELLRELAGSSSFKKATRGSVKPTRMADEELVLRFVAFYLIDNEKSSVKEYKGGMDSLLDSTVEVLNKEKNNSLFLEIRKAFLCSMNNAYYIFGDKAFRKANYINKSLFLGLSRVLCQYSEEEVKQMDTADISERISQALDVGGDLWNPLSMGTNDAKNISTVYEYIKKIMEN